MRCSVLKSCAISLVDRAAAAPMRGAARRLVFMLVMSSRLGARLVEHIEARTVGEDVDGAADHPDLLERRGRQATEVDVLPGRAVVGRAMRRAAARDAVEDSRGVVGDV